MRLSSIEMAKRARALHQLNHAYRLRKHQLNHLQAAARRLEGETIQLYEKRKLFQQAQRREFEARLHITRLGGTQRAIANAMISADAGRSARAGTLYCYDDGVLRGEVTIERSPGAHLVARVFGSPRVKDSLGRVATWIQPVVCYDKAIADVGSEVGLQAAKSAIVDKVDELHRAHEYERWAGMEIQRLDQEAPNDHDPLDVFDLAVETTGVADEFWTQVVIKLKGDENAVFVPHTRQVYASVDGIVTLAEDDKRLEDLPEEFIPRKSVDRQLAKAEREILRSRLTKKRRRELIAWWEDLVNEMVE